MATDAPVLNFNAEFEKLGASPVPKRIRISTGDGLFIEFQGIKEVKFQFGTLNGLWEVVHSNKNYEHTREIVPQFTYLLNEAIFVITANSNEIELKSIKGKKFPTNRD